MSNFMGAALTVDDIYPVGSIYMSVNDIDPAKLFGGTWKRIKERFLLGAGDTHTAGSMGGEFEHKLTIAEMPKHAPDLYYDYGAVHHDEAKHVFQPGSYKATNMYTNMPNSVDTSGYDQPHNTTPPYLAVYIWQRIA